jgi:hypothetical protein
MSENVLDAVYQVPINGPFDERYFHEDIREMNILGIQREYELARLRLTMERRPHPWLLARMDRLREGLNDAN